MTESRRSPGVRGLVSRLVTPGVSLRERVVHAGVWNVALQTASRLLALARVVVLARLLAPEDFGVFAVCLVAISVLEAVTQSGFELALIRKREDVLPYLDTAWTVQLARGALISAGLYLAAGPVARFFEVPRAELLLQVLALAPLVRGLQNIGTITFKRELEFQRQFVWETVQTLVDFTVATVCAVVLRDAIALVLGLLAGRVTGTVVSYWIHAYRPRLRVDWGQVRELRRFGRWVFFNNLLALVYLRGDRVIIGKLLGAPLLGVYEMGWRISEVATKSLSNVVSALSVPAYAKLQAEHDRLRNAYLLTLELTAALALPGAALISVIAGPLVVTALGREWAATAPVLAFLIWAGALRCVVATGGSVFVAVGKPSLDTTMSLIRTVVSFALVFPLVRWMGVPGAGLAILAGIVSVAPVFVRGLHRLVALSAGELARAVFPGTLLSGSVAAAALGATALADGAPPAVAGAAGALAGAAAYALVALVLWRVGRSGPLRSASVMYSGVRRTAPEPT